MFIIFLIDNLKKSFIIQSDGVPYIFRKDLNQ